MGMAWCLPAVMLALVAMVEGQASCAGGSIDDEKFCKSSDDRPVCEGRGTCVCGVCDCNVITPNRPSQRYTGTYCECDNYSCDYYNQMICGGPTRGRCSCGMCNCRLGYTGPACDCPTSQETCRASNGKICNGKGVCKCGTCECVMDDTYRGPTCEDCPFCPGRCEMKKDCVRCVAFNTGPLAENGECERRCSHILLVDAIDGNPNTRECRFQDEDNCFFHFAYTYTGEDIYVARTKECPQPPAAEGSISSSSSLYTPGPSTLSLLLWIVFLSILCSYC